MTYTTDVLPAHHRHCDELFATAEDAVQRGDWANAKAAFERFRAQMKAHFDAEEDILFPAFEAAAGGAGPTGMMRYEHEQMGGLLSQMAEACAARDADAYAGAGETLLMLMQQHNMKEENILYPMCDRVLGEGAHSMGDKLAALLEERDG